MNNPTELIKAVEARLGDDTASIKLEQLLSLVPREGRLRVVAAASEELPPLHLQEDHIFIPGVVADPGNIVSFLTSLQFPDLVIYPMPVQAPYTKTDADLFATLEHFVVPVLAVPVGWNSIQPANREKIGRYLQTKLAKHKQVRLMTGTEDLSEEALAQAIAEQVARIPLIPHASIYRSAFRKVVAAWLIDRCRSRYEAEIRRISQTLKQQEAALEQIKAMNLSWKVLEQQLENHRSETEQRIVETLEHDSIRFIKDLKHSAGNAGNPSGWWEKEMPYQLENFFENRIAQLETLINNDLTASITRMRSEICKMFSQNGGEDVQVTFAFDGIQLKDGETVKLGDNSKLEIGVKLASAGTVSLTMVLLTMVPGARAYAIPMVISQIVGLASRRFMVSRSNKAKEQIQSLIPQKVDFCREQIAQQLSTKLRASYAQIIESLRQEQQHWEQQRKTAVQEEKRKALEDPTRLEWQACINELMTVK